LGDGSEAVFEVTDLVKVDLIDAMIKSASETPAYMNTLCSFGDSFLDAQGVEQSLESILTTEEEICSRALFDGILQLKRTNY